MSAAQQCGDALRILERADLANLKGVWRENILKSMDAVKQARAK